jgi:hypothetical protein
VAGLPGIAVSDGPLAGTVELTLADQLRGTCRSAPWVFRAPGIAGGIWLVATGVSGATSSSWVRRDCAASAERPPPPVTA